MKVDMLTGSKIGTLVLNFNISVTIASIFSFSTRTDVNYVKDSPNNSRSL